jgi:hypothetical protein
VLVLLWGRIDHLRQKTPQPVCVHCHLLQTKQRVHMSSVLVEWSELSSSGYDIRRSSLTAAGRKYLDENVTRSSALLVL